MTEEMRSILAKAERFQIPLEPSDFTVHDGWLWINGMHASAWSRAMFEQESKHVQ